MKYLSLSKTCMIVASLLVSCIQVQPSSALPPTSPEGSKCNQASYLPGCYPGGPSGGAYGGSTDDRNNQAASDLNTLSGERGPKPPAAGKTSTALGNCIKYQQKVKHKSLEEATTICQEQLGG
jgi:hypothetical protein